MTRRPDSDEPNLFDLPLSDPGLDTGRDSETSVDSEHEPDDAEEVVPPVASAPRAQTEPAGEIQLPLQAPDEPRDVVFADPPSEGLAAESARHPPIEEPASELFPPVRAEVDTAHSTAHSGNVAGSSEAIVPPAGPDRTETPPPIDSAPPRDQPVRDESRPIDDHVGAMQAAALAESESVVPARRPPQAGGVPVTARLSGGVADAAVHVAVLVCAVFGVRLLGVESGVEDWLPMLLFLFAFSFLYTIVPLAFWGQTPGMAWAAVVARAHDGGTPTFRQSIVRWLVGWLQSATLGVSLALTRNGPSMGDRLSGTRLFVQPESFPP